MLSIKDFSFVLLELAMTKEKLALCSLKLEKSLFARSELTIFYNIP